MPLPAVPGVEQIGEPVISEARNLMDHRQAEQPPEPSLARGSQPNRDRAVGADVQPAVRIDRMQPATHVLDPDPETGKRVGRETNVKKLNRTGPGRTDQPAALPFDAGIADRAFGIVPDGQFRTHRLPGLMTGSVVAEACLSFFRSMWDTSSNDADASRFAKPAMMPVGGRRTRAMSTASLRLPVIEGSAPALITVAFRLEEVTVPTLEGRASRLINPTRRARRSTILAFTALASEKAKLAKSP
jgi:hypothetical protein